MFISGTISCKSHIPHQPSQCLDELTARPLYAHELKGLKSKMAFGQIQSINGVDYLLRDWISNSFCELWTVTVAVTVNVTMRHCLCSMSHSNSSAVPFRSATLEWVTRLDVDCF